MALSSLIVKIGADVSGLNRGVVQAERVVDRFGRNAAKTGRSVARMGNMASQAAGSLSRLGGAAGGTTGSLGQMVTVLGTAGVVMGETAVLSTALTKSWRLLTVASTALATTLPAALAPLLGNPIVLAVAGVTALAAAVYGISRAWTASARAKREYDQANTVLGGADSVAAFYRDLAMAGQSRPGTHSSGAAISDAALMKASGDAIIGKAGEAVKSSVGEWKQVAAGLRPLTNQIVSDWQAASRKIADAMSLGARLTRDQVTALIALKDALKDVELHTPTISRAGGIRADLFPQKSFGQGLNPRSFLGGRMDFKPTPIKDTEQAKSAIADVANFAVSQMSAMAQSAGRLLADLFGKLQSGNKWGAAAAGVMAVVVGLNNLSEKGQRTREVLRQVFAGIESFVIGMEERLGIISGGEADRRRTKQSFAEQREAIKQGMMEAAKRGDGEALARLKAEADRLDALERAYDAQTGATNRNTSALNALTAELTNVPRVLNVNALRHMASGFGGTGSGPTFTPGGGRDSGGRRTSIGSVTFNIYNANDPDAVADAVGRSLDLRARRGGTSRLTVATA